MSGQYKNANFLKPREKLRLKGVEALSDRELLQLIIGSGSAKISAAKLAKHVLRLIKDSNTLSFKDLLAIPGIGLAQASRLAAVSELNGRFPRPDRVDLFKSNDDFPRLIPEDNYGLWLITLDGANRLIERRALDQFGGTSLIRAICSYMLRDNAARIVILKRVASLAPALDDLSLARNLKLAIRPFEIALDMLLISGNKSKSIIKGAGGVARSL